MERVTPIAKEAGGVVPVAAMQQQQQQQQPFVGAVFHKGNSEQVEQQRDSHKSSTGAGFLFIQAGETKMSGSFVVPEHLTFVVMLKKAVVDLSLATFVHPKTTITVYALLGKARIILPRNVRCESNGFALMGGMKMANPMEPTTVDCPVVVLNGAVLLGSAKPMVNVCVPPLVVVE